MAKRGRPVKGAQLVEDLDGSQAARQRLGIILQTLAGVLNIEEACAVLKINRSRFHVLRRQFLGQAVELLEPRPRGRRSYQPSEPERQLAALQREIVQLKLDLKAAQIREEIALVMPHLLGRRAGGKKTRRPARPNARRGGSTRSAR